MRIAFRVDFGEGVGMGHLTRMSALAEAFSEYGVESSFFSSSDEPINYEGFDMVIVDSYLLSSEYIEHLRKAAPFVVCYDDNALYEYSCDILVNANLYAKTLEYKFRGETPRLLLGGNFALLRREFWEAKPVVIKEVAKKILLSFGGTDINNMTEVVINMLKEIDDIEIIAVFGPVAKGYDHCKKKYQDDKEVVIIQDPAPMSEVMRQCDIAITAGGSTIYELSALGIPSLIVPQADNQLLAAEYFTNEGLMKSLGWWEVLKSDTLVQETISLISDYERRKHESETMRECVNLKGAQLLASKIMGIRDETVR